MNSDISDTNLPQLGGDDSVVSSGMEPELSGLRAASLLPLIVHVDDDQMILELMRCILEELGGYQVISFADGHEALGFCRSTTPSVLITDVARPGLDGLALCYLLRNDPAFRAMPVIIHSAYASTDLMVHAHSLNAHIISKPCSPMHFVERIDRLVQEQGEQIPVRNWNISSLR